MPQERLQFRQIAGRIAGVKPNGREFLHELEIKYPDIADRDVVRKFSVGLAEKTDPERRTVRGYATTRTVDRDFEVVVPGGGDFTDFLKNPITLWSHDYNKPIGKDLELTPDEYGVQYLAELAQTSEPSYVNVYSDLILNGFVKASSIGFIPLSWLHQSHPDFKKRAAALEEKWSQSFDDVNCIIESWLLLERSFCAVPANADSLRLALTKGQISLEPAIVKELGIVPSGAKPYPNEHACRLRDPDDFEDDSFRRVQREHEGKKYSVIMGKLKGEDSMTEQAYRYPKDDWTPDAARAHCKDHDGRTFEPASSGERTRRIEFICSACAERERAEAAAKVANTKRVITRIERSRTVRRIPRDERTIRRIASESDVENAVIEEIRRKQGRLD